MSSQKPVFHYVVPGLLEAAAATSNLSPKGSFPSLEKLLARSEKITSDHDYPHLLANLLQIPLIPGADVPVAVLSATEMVSLEKLKGHCWIKATPVLLKPDRDRLVLHQASTDPENQEQQEMLKRLADELKAYFSPLFSEMLPVSDSGWLIRCDTDYQITTTPLMDAVGRNIDNLLPTGDDHKRWHQVLNEVQMLLHSHNSLDAGFNALWFEGVGRLPEINSVRSDAIALGDDNLLSVLAKWSGAGKSQTLLEVVKTGLDIDSVISAENAVMQAIHSRSEKKWLKAIHKAGHQLAEAMAMLVSGELRCICVYPVNGSVYKLRRNDLLKFWKKTRSLAEIAHQ